MKLKSEAHMKNIQKRGNVAKSLTVNIFFTKFNSIFKKINYFFNQKKEDKMPVGPVLLGVFLFVIVGSGNKTKK